MIVLFLVIILFTIFVIYAKSYINLFEPFSNLGYSLTNSGHFNMYIDSVHPNMYKVKINSFRSNFRQSYLDKLRFPRLDEKKILQKYVKICKKIFYKNKLHRLNNIPWLFLVSKSGLEMNMPYTLSNYIVINENSIKNLSQITKINDHFVNTLIHEKIHIKQRINQGQFNEFYKRTYSFIYKKINITEVPLQYRKIYMSNPDSNKDFWLYRINNKIYYPILIKNGPFVKSMAFGKFGKLDLDKYKKQLGYENDISFYHPNEIFACETTNMIIESRLKKSYINILNL